MRPMKLMALFMALCLMTSICPAALSEEPPLEEETVPVESVDESILLVTDDGEALDYEAVETAEAAGAVEADETAGTAEEPQDGGAIIEAPVPANRTYAVVGADGAPVYPDCGDGCEAAALLSAGDVVLVTGTLRDRTPVAFFADGCTHVGYMDASELLPMNDEQTRICLDELAASGEVGLYEGDLNWPLKPLQNVTFGDGLAVLASTAYSNDTVYTLNGVQISATMVGETGAGNCWKWAQSIYKLAWGCNFSENFAGNDSTGLNLLANLNDGQRTLTASHLRAFIMQTVPGATIRVCACSSECSSFNNDGLSCGHKGHSLIVADKNADGVVMMDNASQHTRYYTWQGFCDSWKGYTYIKYIKWPGAQPLAASSIPVDGGTVAVTGVSLNESILTMNEGETATLVATVAPENATVSSVEWATNDASVASVVDGVVTALKAGTAIVGVRTTDGGFTAGCTVTVKKPVAKKALTKTGGNGTIILGLGEQLQLTADFAVNRGWIVSGVKTSKPGVASISETGLVTAVGVGKTKVTVMTQNRKKAKLTIKVVDPSVPTAVALNHTGTIKLRVGESIQLQAAILPTTATTSFTWATSKASVATVDANGTVTALKKGKCKIAVRTANGKIAKVKIKVVK